VPSGVVGVDAVEARGVTGARQTRGSGSGAEALDYPTRGGGIRYGFDDSKTAFAGEEVQSPLSIEGRSAAE